MPPEAGWPEEFALGKVAGLVRDKQAAQRSMDMFNPSDDPEPYIPCRCEGATDEDGADDSSRYPARRRAQRLSFSVWCIVRAENADLQRPLEAASTSERLRMAVLRIREMRDEARMRGGG